MDQQVNGDGHPLHGSHTDELSVAKEGGGTVVVGVKEGQWLLLEDQEDGINELDVFVDVVELIEICVSFSPSKWFKRFATYVVQNDQRASPTTLLITDGVEDSVSPESGEKLLNEQGQQDTAHGGQNEVVNHEQGVKLEGRQLLHDLTATEDDNVVGDKHHCSLLQGGQRGHTLGEVELAGGIPHDLLVGLVEEGPQVHAEGTIESRDRDIFKDFGRHCDRIGLFSQTKWMWN